MNFSHVTLVLTREIRDQLRDRRTMFMIFVLPILLYPLAGLSLVQVSQFMQEKATRVLVVGASRLDMQPPLLENQYFASTLFANAKTAKLLELTFPRSEPEHPGATIESEEDRLAEARRAVQASEYDAAVFFPDDFPHRLEIFRETLAKNRDKGGERGIVAEVPRPTVIYNTASEKSAVTFVRLAEPLNRWTEKIGEANLEAGGVPSTAAKPFKMVLTDVAEKAGFRGASMWAKILPLFLVLWAMTGAFYPAVDLCAGEKERGTIETLLTSPAGRSEIVLGKLLTIMVFSAVTAALNLACVGVMGSMVVRQFPNVGSPPLMAWVWLPLALLPVTALFSALCLALAAFARSTKEGQYYLMPLMICIMPLVILPMSPSVELSLGNSLVPIMGLVLLLRTLIEGDVVKALPMILPVAAVTLGCCMWALRWAVDQFNSESVLFRENERFDLGLWLRQIIRDRGPTPTVAGAVACCFLIITLKFFLSFSATQAENFTDIVQSTLVAQLGVILAPALCLAAIFVRNRRQTFLIRIPPWKMIPAAIVLAVAIHPVVRILQTVVTSLYPINDGISSELQRFQTLLSASPLWQLLLMMALLPAICEELAFRGFILSGFRHMGQKWRAIILSSLVFGYTHGILQQSIIASLVGMLVGYLAVQSGSILPGVCFHFVHNGLAMASMKLNAELVEQSSVLNALMRVGDNRDVAFRWHVIFAGAVIGVAILAWFSLARYDRTDEEELREAIKHADEVPA